MGEQEGGETLTGAGCWPCCGVGACVGAGVALVLVLAPVSVLVPTLALVPVLALVSVLVGCPCWRWHWYWCWRWCWCRHCGWHGAGVALVLVLAMVSVLVPVWCRRWHSAGERGGGARGKAGEQEEKLTEGTGMGRSEWRAGEQKCGSQFARAVVWK